MSCEKQFLTANGAFLYCSETCRLHDQAPTYTRSLSYSSTTPNSYNSGSPPQSPYTRFFSSTPYDVDGGPDIIPRFSPTQSRPRSYFNSDSYPASTYQTPSTVPSTPPATAYQNHVYANSRSSTALASLRELATALPKTGRGGGAEGGEPDSPPKSRASSVSRTGSGVWNYMPFTQSTQSKTITPGNSYTHTTQSSSTYASAGYGGESGCGGAAKSYGGGQPGAGGYGNTGGMGMDRPLPPRSGPGYGHRPRSIDLVTPFGGH